MNNRDPVERMNNLLSQLDTAVESLSPGGVHRLRTNSDSRIIMPTSPPPPYPSNSRTSGGVYTSAMLFPSSSSLGTASSSSGPLQRISYGASNITHSHSPNLFSSNTLSDLDVRLYEPITSDSTTPSIPLHNNNSSSSRRTSNNLPASVPSFSGIPGKGSPVNNGYMPPIMDKNAQITSVMESAVRIAESAALVVQANVRETKALLQSNADSRRSSSVRSIPPVVSHSKDRVLLSSSHARSSSSSANNYPDLVHHSHHRNPHTKDTTKHATKETKVSKVSSSTTVLHKVNATANRSTNQIPSSHKKHPNPPPLPLSSEDTTEKETKATIALAQKISKYEEKTINRAAHSALQWAFYRLVKHIPPRLDQLIAIHVENRTVEIATFALLRWIHLTWSIHRTSIKPIWVQHDQLIKAQKMSLSDRLYQGLPASTLSGSRRASVVSITSRRSSIEYNYPTTTHRHNSITPENIDSNDFWISESGYQKALSIGKEEALGIPIPRPTRYFNSTVTNNNQGMLRLILQGWKQWNIRYQRIRRRSLQKQQHALFSQWRFFVLQQQTLRAKAEIIESLQARANACRALVAWVEARKLAVQYRLQVKLQTGLEQLDKLQTQRFVRTILSRWKQWSWRNQQAKTFSLRVQQKRVHNLLGRWLFRSKEAIRTTKIIRDNLNRMRTRHLTKVFSAWRKYTDRKALLHKLVKNNQPLFAQRKLVYYLRLRWQKNAHARKQSKLILAKAISIWQNDLLGNLFLGWKRKAHGRRARLQAATTLALNHRYRQLRTALQVWKKDANFSHHCKKVILLWTKASADRIMNQLLSAWHKWAHQRHLRHEQVAKNVQSFQIWRIRIAVQRWKNFNSQRKSFTGIRTHMQHYYAQQAVQKWYKAYKYFVQKRVEEENAFRARAHRLLHVWKNIARTSQHNKQIMLNAIHRFQHSKILSAINHWQNFARTSQHNKQIMLNAIHRFQHSKILSAINHWQRWTEARLLHRASLAHRDNSLLRNTFQRWKRYIQDCRTIRSRGYAAAARMERFCLRLAVIQWREKTKSAQQRRLAVHQFLALSRQQKLTTCFQAWVGYIKQHRQWRILRTKLSSSWQERKLSTVLRQWNERAKEWKQIAMNNQKAVQHSTHHRLSQCYRALKTYTLNHRTWRLHRDEIVKTYRQKKIVEQLREWHQYSRTCVLHRNFIHQMEIKRMERQRTEVFTAWTTHIQQKKVRKERAETAIVTMETYRHHSSIRLWCRRTQMHITRRNKMQDMILRRIGKVFLLWKNKMLRTRTLKEVTKHFLDLRFRRNLQLWFKRAHELSVIRKTYLLAFTHHNTALLSECFTAWKQHTQKHANCRRLRNITAPKVQKLVELNYKRQVFTRYRRFCEEEALRRRAEEAYKRNLRKKAFEEWLRRAQEKRIFRAHAVTAKERLDQLHFRHLLRWWLNWSQRERRARDFRNQLEAKKLEEWKRTVFHQWAYYVVRKRHLHSLVNDLRTEKIIYYTIATVKLWREFTLRRVYAKNIITRATESILNRKIQLALEKWRSTTNASLANYREKIRIAHERADQRRRVLVFRHFRLYIMIQKASRLALKDVLLRLSFKKWKQHTLQFNNQVNGLHKCYTIAENVSKQYAVQQWRQYLHDIQQERRIQLRMSRAAAICHKFRVQSLLRRWKNYSYRKRYGKSATDLKLPVHRSVIPVEDSDEPAPQLRQHQMINDQLSQLGVL